MKFLVNKTKRQIYIILFLLAFGFSFISSVFPQDTPKSELTHKNPFADGLSQISISDSIITKIKNSIAYAEENNLLESTIEQIIEEANSLKNSGCYYQASLILLETLNNIAGKKDQVNRAWCELALSEVCRASLQFSSAIALAKNALVVFDDIESAEGKASCLNRLAAIYYEQNETIKAIEACNNSQILAQQIEDKALIASNYELIGAIHRNNGEFAKAFDAFNKAIEICENLNDTIAKTNVLFNIMLTHLKLENSDSVLFYGLEAYKCATNTGVLSQKSNTANFLATYYATSKEWEEAYKFEHVAKILRNDLFERIGEARLQRLYADYNLGQQEILIKEQTKMLSKAKQKRKVFVVVVISLAIIILIMFNFYILKYRSEEKIIKQNKLLVKQKEQIKQQATELKLQNEKLIELGQFKESMMNMVVHDLKTPLSTMINLSKFAVGAEILPLLSQSARQMLNLVNNILDINRYEKAALEPVLSTENLFSIYSEVFEEFEYFLKEKKILVVCEIPDNVIVSVDKDLIKRVFVNLLDNAIKYSPLKGKITINLDLEQETSTVVHITNEGPSIPSKHHQTIFKKYVQVGQLNKVTGKSTGLGLTFCKLAIEAHGGKIGVNSSGEFGVDFWFSIPMP